MAFVTKQDKRIEHPTEPGTWAVIRVPLSAGDYAAAQGETAAAKSLDLMPRVIQSWSYAEPITPEQCALLDGATFAWLDAEIAKASPVRTEAEKKDSGSPYSPTSEPGGEPSPPNSGT
ncbi:MAG: hypothetical protein AB7I38_10955 [Dehalococcoidia bacterium]